MMWRYARRMLDTQRLYTAIEAVRQSRGHSQNDVARMIDVPSGTFTRMKSGKMIGLKAYIAMLDYMNIRAPYTSDQETAAVGR